MTDFENLYRCHAASLYRYALYLCGNRADAEDVVAETFVRAWNAPVDIRAGTAKAYLFTIARNCFLHAKRRASRQVELDEQLPDPSPGALAVAEQKERLGRVRSALGLLPELDRSALLLRAVEDMSYQEIAAALQLTVAAVKTKIHRARLRLAHLQATPEVER